MNELCIFVSTHTVLSHRYFTHRHTWEDAEKDCREHSAHLSSVISATEQEFINGMNEWNEFFVGFICVLLVEHAQQTTTKDVKFNPTLDLDMQKQEIEFNQETVNNKTNVYSWFVHLDIEWKTKKRTF